MGNLYTIFYGKFRGRDLAYMEYRIIDDHKQMECQGVHMIHLTQDSVKWLALGLSNKLSDIINAENPLVTITISH